MRKMVLLRWIAGAVGAGSVPVGAVGGARFGVLRLGEGRVPSRNYVDRDKVPVAGPLHQKGIHQNWCLCYETENSFVCLPDCAVSSLCLLQKNKNADLKMAGRSFNAARRAALSSIPPHAFPRPAPGTAAGSPRRDFEPQVQGG